MKNETKKKIIDPLHQIGRTQAACWSFIYFQFIQNPQTHKTRIQWKA